MRLDHFHRSIIHYLGHRKFANTNKVADDLKMAWATAEKKLRELEMWGYVIKRRSRRRGSYSWQLINL